MEHSPAGALTIRFIDSRLTLPLRAAVLRPGKSLDAVRFPGDDEAASFHLGAFIRPAGSRKTAAEDSRETAAGSREAAAGPQAAPKDAHTSSEALDVPAPNERGQHPHAVVSFLPHVHPDFNEPSQYQLRGMATDPHYRGLGAGKALVQFALRYLKENNVKLLWCNAREDAIPFYLKCGFRETGPLFMIPDVCLHKLMYIFP